MNIIADSKGVYAQSSDIKSRTYLQYRSDMKRKAIVELEVVDWFEEKLKELHATDNVTVEKSGGDAHIWFLRSAKISGEPDYVARINDEKRHFEFQYANDENLPFYDFKVSKVGKKVRGKRVPHSDREFLYLLMPSNRFAVFSPEWVMQNGREAGVPAWGNRTAFRVPGDAFNAIFQSDLALAAETESIRKKIAFLETQSKFIEGESEKLSGQLQSVVDHEKTFKIVPKTPGGFYKACFLMDQINKRPENDSMWLVYGASFYSAELNSRELARLIYALDFLYGGSRDLDAHVLNSFVDVMRKITARIASMQKQNLQTDANLSPKEEVVNFLFTVNLYEDIIQELRCLYGVDCFPPVDKIFQSVEHPDSIFKQISDCGLVDDGR